MLGISILCYFVAYFSVVIVEPYKFHTVPLTPTKAYRSLLRSLRKSYCFYKTCYRGRLSHSNIGSLLFSYTLADARISGKSQLASFWILGMIKPRISLRETIRLVQRPYVRQNNFKKIIEPSQQHSHMRRRYILRLSS